MSGFASARLAATSPGAFARLVGIALSAQELLIIESDPTAVHVWNQEVYAADSVGTDSYAIAVPSSFPAYVAGMRFYFKAGTANTGTATRDAVACASGGRPTASYNFSTAGQSTATPTMRRRGVRACSAASASRPTK